jgi:hypothetical protein
VTELIVMRAGDGPAACAGRYRFAPLQTTQAAGFEIVVAMTLPVPP